MDMTSVFAEITKTAPQEDGSLLVYGKATGSDLDLDGQRCDPIWLQNAMPEFMKIGNVREQHDSRRAVGKAFEHDVKDDGHYIRARIVDPVAVAKTKAGIFTGFSIGISQPHLSKSPDAVNGVIDSGKIIEVSLVDRPALPTATLTVCKAAKPGMSVKAGDFDSERLLVRVEELVEKAVEPDVEKSGEMTVTLADALDPEQVERLEEIAADKSAAPDAPCCDKCSVPGDSCCDVCPPATKAAEPDEFDVEAAKTLIAETVAKADSGLGQDESGDIDGATQAIGIIARLIQSEAKDLEDTPAQGCDIDLLMQAVHALRIFTCREAKEQAGIDPGPAPILLAAEADLEKADNEPYGDVEYADPGYQKDKKKRYPVDTKEHARAALAYISKPGNASEYSPADLAKVKARIEAACKKFGIDVSDKAIEPEVEKTIETEEAPVADIVETEDDAEKAVEPVIEKTADVEKTVEPEVEKASTVEVDTEAVEKAVAEALAKAFSAEELEKEDNPLRKTFNAIVEATAKSAAGATSELVARLEKVEQMAVPGGPALRRTEIDRAQARKADLEQEAMRYKALASATRSSGDHMLAKGYDHKAAALEVELKTL